MTAFVLVSAHRECCSHVNGLYVDSVLLISNREVRESKTGTGKRGEENLRK